MSVSMGARKQGEESKKILARLRRLEGQVRGLERMVEKKASCEDILIQFSALKAAFESVGVQVMSRVLEECLEKEAPRPSFEAVGKAMTLFRRYAIYIK